MRLRDDVKRVANTSEAYSSDCVVEIVRQRSFEILPFAYARVTKAELPRVEHLAGQIFREPRRVDFIAQHRVTEMMQVDADLMGAATVQFTFNQTCLVVRTKNPVFGFGGAPVR